MSEANQEHRVAGEAVEQVYDGAYFLAKYIEVAEADQEAKKLLKRADGITAESVAKLMDPETGEPLYGRSSHLPPHLADELALGSLEALIYRSRAEFLSKKANKSKSEFVSMYMEHYLGRELRITSLTGEGPSPIQKTGVTRAGLRLTEVTGQLAGHDIYVAVHNQPLLSIRGTDWYSVEVLDRETLELLINIETLE